MEAGDGPVERDLDPVRRPEIDEAAGGEVALGHPARMQAPAEAGERHVEEAVGRGHPVDRAGEVDAERRLCPARLEEIAPVEAQAGGGRQRLGGDAAGKVARHEVRARAGRIAQRAERQRPAALHRLALGRHRREHLARAQSLRRIGLVVEGEIERGVDLAPERRRGRRKPRRQAVGIDGDRQRQPFAGAGGGAAERRRQIVLEKPHPVEMGTQRAAELRRLARLAAHDQDRAEPFFEPADALRDRRRRDAEHGRGALERAFAHHGGDGGEGGIIQHAMKLCFIGLSRTSFT